MEKDKSSLKLDVNNCYTCIARNLCREQFPKGVIVDFDCKKLIKMLVTNQQRKEMKYEEYKLRI